MKLAAVDIGSNAVRLLFTNVYETPEGPKFIKDSIYRVPLRLGEEAFLNGNLSKDKIKQMVLTMSAFQKLMTVHEVDAYMICATSAMREAKNAKDVVKAVQKKTGLNIEIISGQMEAEIIFSNHAEKLSLHPDYNYLYIDVGGGSTEMVLIHKGEMIDKRSFNIGTLRIKYGKVRDKHWAVLEDWCMSFKEQYQPLTAIGSGGSINTLIKSFGSRKKGEMSKEELEKHFEALARLTTDEMVIRHGVKPDRADVLIPALQIYLKTMNMLDMKNVFVPKMGLSDGMIHVLYEKLKKGV